MSSLPFRWHVLEIVTLVALAFVYRGFSPRRAKWLEVVGALVAAAAVLLWPMGDLATHVSLSAAVVQRLVLMLIVVPVLMRATPVGVLERLTRPAIVDAVTNRVSHPGVAIATVTVIGTFTLSPAAISWGARYWFAHVALLVVTVLAGIVLWIPGLGMMPGARHLSPAGRAGYLFASALVVTSLSFIWIFATKPLYPALHGQEAILGITPLFDQQLAGFIAKLGAYLPLWAISFYIFFHAEDMGAPVEESPLHWADVERHLLRADRQRERERRRHGERASE